MARTGSRLERELPFVMTTVLAAGLLAMVVITWVVLRGRAERIVRDRLSNSVREIAKGAEGSLDERRRMLGGVARNPAVEAVATHKATAAQEEETRAALAQLASRTNPLPVELWDAQGNVVFSAGVATEKVPHPSLPVAEPPDETVFFSKQFRDGNAVRFWSMAPIVVAGQRAGWVAQPRTVSGSGDIQRLLREMLSEDLTLGMHNDDGTVWSTAPGKPVDAPISSRMTSAGLTYTRRDGDYAAEEVRLKGTPFIMVMESPMSWIYARPGPTVRLLLVLSAILLVAGALASWLFSRRITSPIITELEDRAASTTAANLQLRAALDELEQANKAKGDFLAMMSHELRTPLNAIAGYADLIDMGVHGPVTDGQREALSRLNRSKNHLLSLIENVLEYGRINAGQSSYIFTDARVSSLLDGIDHMFQPTFNARNILFDYRPCVEDPKVRCDVEKVRQIVINLVGNAVKYTPAGGRIVLESAAVEGGALIRVRDTGIGIAPERLPLVFEPFVQGERALNRPNEGVGLGLAISRELARGMGATIDAESKPGVGSTFTLVLRSSPRSETLADYMPASARV